MNPALLDELQDAIDIYFLFAERMIDQAFFELTQRRPVECRVLICRAIDQLDRALKRIWESERMSEEQSMTTAPAAASRAVALNLLKADVARLVTTIEALTLAVQTTKAPLDRIEKLLIQVGSILGAEVQ